MRPVPPSAAARRVRCAVPSAKASLQGSRVALSSTITGLRRPMTAALVIAPMVAPREVPAGVPWMVRLSMGSPDVLLRVTSGPRPQLPGSRP